MLFICISYVFFPTSDSCIYHLLSISIGHTKSHLYKGKILIFLPKYTAPVASPFQLTATPSFHCDKNCEAIIDSVLACLLQTPSAQEIGLALLPNIRGFPPLPPLPVFAPWSKAS